MGRLIRYEWKKIWQSRMVQGAVLACSVFILFCIYMSIMQLETYDKRGNRITGIDAVREVKKAQEVLLNQEEVNQIVKEYLDYTKNPQTSSDKKEFEFLSEKVYRTWYLPRKEQIMLIKNGYAPLFSETDMKTIFEENYRKDFAQSCVQRKQEMITYEMKNGSVTKEQAQYWMEKVEGYPIIYGKATAWEGILGGNNASWILLIMLVVCIGAAPVFAGEYQSRADSILLCMRYGKSKLISAKILATFLFASSVYIGMWAGVCGIYLAIFGAAGMDLPLEVYYLSMAVSLPLTMGEAVLVVSVLGLFVTWGITALTLCLSAVFKSAYGVIIIDTVMIFSSFFLYSEYFGYGMKHILALLPSSIDDLSFQNYTAYTFGSMTFSLPQTLAAAQIILGVLFVLLAHYKFQSHQVNR